MRCPKCRVLLDHGKCRKCGFTHRPEQLYEKVNGNFKVSIINKKIVIFP